MSNDQPTGIAGLVGRETVGAALSIGVKGPSGAPVEKDRFHVLHPVANANNIRPHHPMFGLFNSADPKLRQMVMGQIVHPSRDDVFVYSRRCQTAKGKPAHPSKVPYCIGNGVDAKRYMGADNAGSHVFTGLPCLGDRCEFAQGVRPECKPWGKMVFRLTVGEKSPTTLVKYTTQSWNTIRNLIGFFDLVESQARAVGLSSYSLIGLRFTMHLTEHTSAANKSRFPVVRIVPVDDPIAFFAAQMERRERAAALAEPLPMRAIEVDDDFDAHMPGTISKPGGAE